MGRRNHQELQEVTNVDMVKRQTRSPEKAVPEWACEFDSHYRHQCLCGGMAYTPRLERGGGNPVEVRVLSQAQVVQREARPMASRVHQRHLPVGSSPTPPTVVVV